MKTYDIQYSKGATDWEKIPKLTVDVRNWNCPDPGITTTFQLVWNEDGITYHGVSKEEHILARYDAQNQPVWTDSCMEYFFRPNDDDLRYFNFECNPNGAIYCGLGTDMPDRVRLLAQDEKNDFQIKTARIDGGWEMYLTVSTVFIRKFFPGYELKEGKVIFANCLKCGDDTPIRHSLSWNPYPEGSPRTFHNSNGFGKMVLVK